MAAAAVDLCRRWYDGDGLIRIDPKQRDDDGGGIEHHPLLNSRRFSLWEVALLATSVAVIVAIGVSAGGRREVLGMDMGRSEVKRRTEFVGRGPLYLMVSLPDMPASTAS